MKTYTVTEYEMEDYKNFREGMTNEEAVELLNRIERGWIPDYNFDGTEGDYENYQLHQAIYKGIEALKTVGEVENDEL